MDGDNPLNTYNWQIVIEASTVAHDCGMNELSACQLAIEVFDVENYGGMLTQSVALMRDGVLVDRFDGSWASGSPVACQL